MTISQVRSVTSGAPVAVQGALTYVGSDECYLEATDRSGGIFVQGPTAGVALGDVVEALGTVSTVGGEQAIVNATITPLQGRKDIAPFGLRGRGLGGAALPGLPAIWDYVRVPKAGGGYEMRWTPAGGARNTGLLVTTWGTVKQTYGSPSAGMRWFYVDDGAGVVSDLGDIGVLVYGDADVNKGDFVAVTGLSSVEPSLDDASKLVRVVRTRSAGDVAVPRPRPVLERPFSDEFDKPTLDPRWAVAADTAAGGGYSLSQDPGSFTLVAATSTVPGSVYHRTQVIQLAEGDWDLEVKVRLSHEEGEPMDQWFGLILAQRIPYLWGAYQSPIDDATLLAGAYYYHPTGAPPPYRMVRAGLNGAGEVPREGDTCYFRASKRGNSIQASYSPDGLDYSLTGTTSVLHPCPFFMAYVGSSGLPAGLFSAAIDYVRFTPVTP